MFGGMRVDSDSIKLKSIIRVGVVTLILYSLTALIYFTSFYEPFKPIYGQANESVKSFEQKSLILFFILGFLLCLLVSLLISIVYNEISIYISPVMIVNARLKSKEADMAIYGNYRGFSNVGFNYSLTFETEDGNEISFRVQPKHYATIIEGNIGILKYKQGIYKRFASFDIKQVG